MLGNGSVGATSKVPYILAVVTALATCLFQKFQAKEHLLSPVV